MGSIVSTIEMQQPMCLAIVDDHLCIVTQAKGESQRIRKNQCCNLCCNMHIFGGQTRPGLVSGGFLHKTVFS